MRSALNSYGTGSAGDSTLQYPNVGDYHDRAVSFSDSIFRPLPLVLMRTRNRIKDLEMQEMPPHPYHGAHNPCRRREGDATLENEHKGMRHSVNSRRVYTLRIEV